MIKKSLKMLMSCNKEWLKIQPLLYMARKNEQILVKVMEAFLVLKSGIFWILNYSLKILNLKLKLIWWFKFVTSLVIEFKKMKSNDAARYSRFILTYKLKQLFMKATLMMYLNLQFDYIKHSKIHWKRLWLDYWFSPQPQY